MTEPQRQHPRGALPVKKTECFCVQGRSTTTERLKIGCITDILVMLKYTVWGRNDILRTTVLKTVEQSKLSLPGKLEPEEDITFRRNAGTCLPTDTAQCQEGLHLIKKILIFILRDPRYPFSLQYTADQIHAILSACSTQQTRSRKPYSM